MSTTNNHKRRGFTLLEITLSTAVLLVMARLSIEAINGMHGATTQSSVSTRLQQNGEAALMHIITDLNRSGFASYGGKSFPLTFTDGDAPTPFDLHDHAPATHHAAASEPSFGSSREIVFLQPRDGVAGGVVSDEVPDIDGMGKLIWSADEFSYVLATIDGINVLQRRVNNAAPTTVATNVERVLFELAGETNISISGKSVRVRLFLRDVDEKGAIEQYTAEAVVRLRNG